MLTQSSILWHRDWTGRSVTLTVRQISYELDTPRSCVHHIIKRGLTLKTLKKMHNEERSEPSARCFLGFDSWGCVELRAGVKPG